MFWRFNNMCTTNIDNLLNDEVSGDIILNFFKFHFNGNQIS
jgi:hypothetical protein